MSKLGSQFIFLQTWARSVFRHNQRKRFATSDGNSGLVALDNMANDLNDDYVWVQVDSPLPTARVDRTRKHRHSHESRKLKRGAGEAEDATQRNVRSNSAEQPFRDSVSRFLGAS